MDQPEEQIDHHVEAGMPANNAFRQVQEIAAADQKVTELGRLLQGLRLDSSELDCDFLQKCRELSEELLTEKKTNAEDLRIINQDINHLEEFRKDITQSQQKLREKMIRKLIMLKSQLDDLNASITMSGIGEEHAVLLDERIPIWLHDAASSEPPMLLNFQFNAPKQQCDSPMNRTLRIHRPNAFVGAQQFPYPVPSMVENNSLRGLSPFQFPPNFQMIGAQNSVYREENNKIKNCAFCQEQIHRNAPVCPYCKHKIVSKTQKKPKRLS